MFVLCEHMTTIVYYFITNKSYFPMFWAIVPLQLQIAVMKSLRFTLVDYLS